MSVLSKWLCKCLHAPTNEKKLFKITNSKINKYTSRAINTCFFFFFCFLEHEYIVCALKYNECNKQINNNNIT